MATAQETMQLATELLKEGKIQEAHDLLGAKLQSPDPPVLVQPEPEKPPIPEWVSDAGFAAGLLDHFLPFLEQVVIHLGNTPVLQQTFAPIHKLGQALKK